MNQFGRANESITEDELKRTAHVNHMTSTEVGVGTRIWTVAYPLATINYRPGHVDIHAQSDAFEGRITKHYPNGRDQGFLRWPRYETDMDIKMGASGGPVFVSGSSGVVFGVNCTGMDPPHRFACVVVGAPCSEAGRRITSVCCWRTQDNAVAAATPPFSIGAFATETQAVSHRNVRHLADWMCGV